MVGRAKSLALRRIENAQIMEELVTEAAKRYTNQGSHSADGDTSKRKSIRTIALEVSADHPRASRRHLVPSQSTITRRLQGKPSRKDALEKRSNLTKAECQAAIKYVIECSNRCIPFSHSRLKEHLNELIRARIPDFPGIGVNFTQRFVDRHRDQLSTSWSHTLDGKRAGAVNPTTNKAWFKLLGNTIIYNNIDDENIYGMDETGIQGGEGQGERVIVAAENPNQGQTRSGGRENNTVIVTICGDGTSIPPTVIFKGKHYLVQWKQDNPLNASIGHSQKGWVNGEIAIEWIKNFDECTSAKAAGRPRLLLLDGHASHLTRAFLEYARQNGIIVLCYPSHATHVYQGLDVVCFSVFKKHWSAHRDKYERDTGLVVQKSNFIAVMSRAYVQAFTPDNIRKAFRKTGVIPFNPSAISEDLLAPSMETSTKGSLPIRQPSPIQEIVDVLMHTLSDNDDEMSEGDNTASAIRKVLASTPAGFRVDPSGIPIEEKTLPMATDHYIEPISTETLDLLSYVPQTDQESKLHAALREFAERDRQHMEAARYATATAVLQGIYCKGLKQRLYAKKNTGQKRSGRLLGDGLPAMLTGDRFMDKMTDQDDKALQEQRVKAARKEVDERYKGAMATWKQENRKRIDQNRANSRQFKADMDKWKAEKELAKRQGREPRWSKPVKARTQPPIPKPVREEVELPSDTDGSSPGDSSDDGDESDDDYSHPPSCASLFFTGA